MILALLLALWVPAFGQDDATADTDTPSESDVDIAPEDIIDPEQTLDAPEVPAEEVQTEADDADDAPDIVVYGEHLVEKARQAVERDLIEQGYDDVIRKDGYTLYRHSSAWKGEVQVHDDGWIRMKRQPVQFKPPEGSPLGWATCIAVPFCVRQGGQTVSKKKHMAQRRRALTELEPLARQYGDRVADLHVDRRLDDLPDRLEALWNDGVPLEEGADPLPTVKQRKQALLAYWESRTETVWGRRVRAAVELFIRGEVQQSPFPFTPDEIETFNLDRHTDTVLDLDRSMDDILTDLDARAGL